MRVCAVGVAGVFLVHLAGTMGCPTEMSTNGDLRLEAAEASPEFYPAEFPKDRSTKRVIEPAERIAEILFGLIMVLTFTGSLSVAEAGREDVRAMLIGALGCNLAWGAIDGLFYLMGCLARKAGTSRPTKRC